MHAISLYPAKFPLHSVSHLDPRLRSNLKNSNLVESKNRRNRGTVLSFFLSATSFPATNRIRSNDERESSRAVNSEIKALPYIYIHIYISLDALVAKRDDTLARVDGGRGVKKGITARGTRREREAWPQRSCVRDNASR